MTIDSLKLFISSQIDQIYGDIDNQLLIYLQGESKSGVIVVNSLQFGGNKLTELIDEAKKELGKIQCKLIGEERLISNFKRKCQEVQILKEVVRHDSFEFVFYGKQNRLRISKEEPKVPKKVLIVDDSKTIRQLLKRIITSDKDLEVVATAERPSEVEALIKEHKPDVITLDIHMPEMDGVTLLKKLLPIYKIPTIMISSISMEEGPMVLNALEIGAVDYVQKPSLEEIKDIAPLIIEKVKIAAKTQVSMNNTIKNVKKTVSTNKVIDSDSLCVFGASTGGTEALKNVLVQLPKAIPPILIVQHIPAVFSKAFADRLNTLCPFVVKEAKDGDLVQKGHVFIAPGGKQMGIKKVGDQYKIVVNDDPPVNRHQPSVDYMFSSVANKFDFKGNKCVAAVFTGMGADGARELATLKGRGALTIAQDEESSVVFGMPKEAINTGKVDHILPLDQISEKIVSLL